MAGTTIEPELSGSARILDAMPGAEMLATIPEWVVPTHDEVMELLRACGGPLPRAGYVLGRERAAYWVVDIVWSTPVSRRVGDRPITWAEAQAERQLAAWAAGARTSITARERQQMGELTRSDAVSERKFAVGVEKTLAWLLGDGPALDASSALSLPQASAE